MRVESLILRLLRLALPRGLRMGLRAGGMGAAPAKPRKDMTPEEREQHRAARQAEKRARQAQRITRCMR